MIEHAGDGDYLISIMTAESFEQSSAAAEKSLHSIDAYHQEFEKDTWESGSRLELLVDLNRIDEVR